MALQDAILDWYGAVRRDLPWRRTRDPYAILVSEVMLQQTQVARVVSRYEAWVARWPTAGDLGAATTADVLRAWVGLGYNSRALRLREACIVVARDGWPADAAGLRALPGVGPYTAAAVASFAFGEPGAAVDTNVRRVSARLGQGTPQQLLPRGREADWNQALMELGALVCGARSAACEDCPAAPWCASQGRVQTPQRGPRARSERFIDSNRWVRGRVVAALAAGHAIPGDIEPARLAHAIEGLLRDGLIRREGAVLSLGG
jgi:A/G-specific adenine glycosylase